MNEIADGNATAMLRGFGRKGEVGGGGAGIFGGTGEEGAAYFGRACRFGSARYAGGFGLADAALLSLSPS
jgi:hypothetical protein